MGSFADQQNGIRVVEVRHRGERVLGAAAPSAASEAGVVAGAVMIDVVRAERGARELLQQIIFFVGGVVRADHAERVRAVLSRDLLRSVCATSASALPSETGSSLPLRANQRRLQALGMVREIESVAALDAEKLAVDAGVVAIVAANDLVVAHAQRGLAAVRAVRADGADVLISHGRVL